MIRQICNLCQKVEVTAIRNLRKYSVCILKFIYFTIYIVAIIYYLKVLSKMIIIYFF